jgi:uncharacterized OB-fold protein
MICWCSLAGTTACNNCPNNLYSPELTRIYTSTKVKPTVQYWCDNCDSMLIPYQKYCHNCGKEIDWSEIFKDAE